MKASLVLLLAAAVLRAAPNADHYDQFNQSHYSTLLGAERQYRVTLPASYGTSGAAYPVIYFFHGWSGWNPGVYDFARIDSLVAARDAFILVMPDGYFAPTDGGPYNVSTYCVHEQQYADYFTELTAHVDSAYRTVPNRTGRGIIGFSMGGFMAYFLPWKFPHRVAGTVNICGSAEFPVGTPAYTTLVSWRYAMANMHGVRLRLHNSTSGELHYLNTEVHLGTLREKRLAYEYAMYPGGHQIDETGEITNFITAVDYVQAAFTAPLPAPARWYHADMYADFEVWGYRVSSDKSEPGFIELADVTDNGFGVRTRRWLPHGRMLPGVTLTVTTAPVYDADTEYSLFDYNVTRDSGAVTPVTSDAEGRIAYTVNHDVHQLGVYSDGGEPALVCIGHAVDDSSRFLVQGRECALAFRVLNRGGSTARSITAALSVYEDGVAVAESVVAVADIPAGSTAWTNAFLVTPAYDPPDDGRPHQVRCNLVFRDGRDSAWEDETDVPVWFDVSPFTRVEIDDGVDVSDDGTVLGTGDGDGIPEPGETIMVYEKDWRTRLYYEDPYLDPQDETLYQESQPSVWPQDGLTHTSLITIPAACPPGHRIRFLGDYEIKISDTIRRMVRWGTVELVVGQAWSGVAERSVAPGRMAGLPDFVTRSSVCPVPRGSDVEIMATDGTMVRELVGVEAVDWVGMGPGVYVVVVRSGGEVWRGRVVLVGE